MRNHHQKGFTLTEILIAIVILGVMAGLAIPSYRTTMMQAQSNEARANLNVIFMAEKIYWLNNNTCWPPAGATVGMANITDSTNLAAINTGLNTDLNVVNYYLSVTSTTGLGPAADFTATASLGNAGAKTFSVSRLPLATGGVITEGGNYS